MSPPVTRACNRIGEWLDPDNPLGLLWDPYKSLSKPSFASTSLETRHTVFS